MSFAGMNREINKVGVIGSGNIGPDITLFLSKVFTPYGVPVVLVDIAPEALDRGRARIRKKLDKGVASGAFQPDFADRMTENIRFTTDYADLSGADLVIEAATEELSIKEKIFAELERVCAPDALLASNSSHLEPDVIFDRVRAAHRCLVAHFFFPAERNLIVEIVPHAKTDPAITTFAMKFFEAIGKVPIRVKGRYGYAVNPVFEGLFHAALLLVDRGYASEKVVDAIAQKALKMGVGPFTGMNLTGGTPITYRGMQHYHTKIMPWFGVHPRLEERFRSGEPWPAAGRGEVVEYDEATYEAVARRLQGAYLGLVNEVYGSGIVELGDLELAVETALVIEGPFKMMNRLGIETALSLVQAYAEEFPGFTVADPLITQAKKGEPWKIPVVYREDHGDVAVVTIRRPQVLNALNGDVTAQLSEIFAEIDQDPAIKAAVLKGFGVKAFVSGADIRELAELDSPEAAERLSLRDQAVITQIENLGKPVVCAYNGLALGGGNELAMGCTARIARKGMKVLAGQPEPNLGLIPGAGGTQRLPRIVGMENAWPMLRTGKPIDSAKALEIGLISEEVSGDLLEAAISFAREIAEGKRSVPPIPKGPIAVPENLPDVDIGHLSRKIDEILQKAILEGARMTLEEGLKREAYYFGRCFATEDCRIGLSNFLENGPRTPAKFVHR